MRAFFVVALHGFCMSISGVAAGGQTNLPPPSSISIALDPITYLITGPTGVLDSNDIPTGATVSQTVATVTSNLQASIAAASGGVAAAQASITLLSTNATNHAIRLTDVEARATALEGQGSNLVAATNAYMPTFTGQWSLVYSDASTNKQEIPIGPIGSYLRSAGASAVPVWDLPRAQGTNLYLSSIMDVIPLNSFLVGTGSNATPRSLDYLYTTIGLLAKTNMLDYLKTVDGASSGLDADTVDGFDSSAWLRTGQWSMHQSITNRIVGTTSLNLYINTNYVGPQHPRFLATITNLTAEGASLTNYGNGSWGLIVTNSADSVQANLDAHKGSNTAHAALFAAKADTNDNRWIRSTTNASGLITWVSNTVSLTAEDISTALSGLYASSNQGALAETAVQVEVDPASVHVDGSSSMNGHLVMNAYKGVITGTNSLILPLSANADAEYSQGGGHISLLSKSLGGAVQIVAYDPTGAARRVEFYVGSDMNVPAATIESDGFHGVGSGITGLTPEQCGAVSVADCPTTTAYQVTWADDTNTIIVTDGGGMSEAGNGATGVYVRTSATYFTNCNSAGWNIDYGIPDTFGMGFLGLDEHFYGDYSGSPVLPTEYVGSETIYGFTGVAHLAWGKLPVLVTNSIAWWPGIITNIVGVSTQLQYYSQVGMLTNVLMLK